ncbi:LysM peptidoglycan-binding domain-containing protein [Bacillus sp. ISL-4]|uniref:LysM peptidoglycan-binding domain-containing protein n=1 Tax=Bacillus sp. ISL-4 TaxID=2819125 RepID=UPI001BE570F0|nr:LysM domain-containing protein [Bacillus sp. ISL-4]MBT2665488.1 LysM peptidoglycan-binding domain-containing protein [Bacillus sp. ISL-4]
MKRLLLFISFCFTLFIIYFDLTTGTLPASHPPASTGEPAVPASQSASAPSAAYKEITMKPGDTLLSIVEKGGSNQPIETIIADFQSLNEGLKPENMQIGKTYKIPIYK